MKHRWPFVIAWSLACGALADGTSGPQPAPPAAPIVAPQDVDFPGVIQISVDATDTARGIFKVHETVPVPPGGNLVLLYPEWLPGAHAPAGPLDRLAGLGGSSRRGANRMDARRRRRLCVPRTPAGGHEGRRRRLPVPFAGEPCRGARGGEPRTCWSSTGMRWSSIPPATSRAAYRCMSASRCRRAGRWERPSRSPPAAAPRRRSARSP